MTTDGHPPTSSFDHLSPEMAGPGYWDAIRELQALGPVVWVESCGGYWAVTAYDVLMRVAQDWQTFTSSEGVSITRASFEAMPRLAPIELDPPRQRTYRKRVNPHLTMRTLTELEDGILAITDELIDTFVEDGRCDLVGDFARKLPGTILFRLVFNATDEDFALAEPAARTLSFDPDKTRSAAAAAVLRDWAASAFADRVGRPLAGDVVDAIATLGDGGEEWVDHEFLSGLQLLISGGVGTSASSIAVAMRMLAEDQELQARVRANPELVPSLVEEVLRLEPPLTMMFRTATTDTELEGCRIEAGQKVALLYSAANRDPAAFDDPERLVLGRPTNRHLAFSVGPHRCIGSNLARLQMRIALTRLLERLGPFHLTPGGEVTYVALQARGPASLPLDFEAAVPVG